MVTQKGQPTFGRLGVPRRSAHPAGNGSLRYIETEHEKLAVDAGRSPRGILSDHSENQVANFFGSLSSPNLPPDFRDQPPIHLKTGPVPPNDRFRGHDAVSYTHLTLPTTSEV